VLRQYKRWLVRSIKGQAFNPLLYEEEIRQGKLLPIHERQRAYGNVSITAAQAMAASQSKDVAPALDEAKQFLVGLIGFDGMPVTDIQKEAKDAGMSWATMRRAKEPPSLHRCQCRWEEPDL